MTKYYKFLTADNKGKYSKYDFTEYLPVDGKPGKWLYKIDNIEMCERGYHCFTPEHILEWLSVQLYEVEIKGRRVHGDNKTVAQQMRFIRKVDTWNDRCARLFACWCAERVLPLFEKEYPVDKRPRETIEVARRYAEGNATDDELNAAWDAAADVARDAALDVARAAAWVAARAAAWAAAGAAAADVARDAAWAAAGDAAWAAAGDAAWAAAGAAAADVARDAAWAAAGAAAADVARDAAMDAAGDVEERAQTQYLLSELGISDED